MLMHVKYVAFMIPVYLLLIFFVSMQDECEQMGAYLTEVKTVDENTWLTTTFLHPIVNTGTVFSKSIICKKDNSCDIIKSLIHSYSLVSGLYRFNIC